MRKYPKIVILTLLNLALGRTVPCFYSCLGGRQHTLFLSGAAIHMSFLCCHCSASLVSFLYYLIPEWSLIISPEIYWNMYKNLSNDLLKTAPLSSYWLRFTILKLLITIFLLNITNTIKYFTYKNLKQNKIERNWNK